VVAGAADRGVHTETIDVTLHHASAVSVACACLGRIGTIAIQANLPVATRVVVALARHRARYALANSTDTDLPAAAVHIARARVWRHDAAVIGAQPPHATIAGTSAPNRCVSAESLEIAILIVAAVRVSDAVVRPVNAKLVDAAELVVPTILPRSAV